MEIQRELETFNKIDAKRQNSAANKVWQAGHAHACRYPLSYLVSPHLKKVSDTKCSNFITKALILTRVGADRPKFSND